MIMTIVNGSKKKKWPNKSTQLRTRFGNMLFTMSMRMCSFAKSVHDAQMRNTAENRYHCNSSQEFEELEKTLRTMALTVATNTAARMSQATHLPSFKFSASIARLSLSRACKPSSPSRPASNPGALPKLTT